MQKNNQAGTPGQAAIEHKSNAWPNTGRKANGNRQEHPGSEIANTKANPWPTQAEPETTHSRTQAGTQNYNRQEHPANKRESNNPTHGQHRPPTLRGGKRKGTNKKAYARSTGPDTSPDAESGVKTEMEKLRKGLLDQHRTKRGPRRSAGTQMVSG